MDRLHRRRRRLLFVNCNSVPFHLRGTRVRQSSDNCHHFLAAGGSEPGPDCWIRSAVSSLTDNAVFLPVLGFPEHPPQESHHISLHPVLSATSLFAHGAVAFRMAHIFVSRMPVVTGRDAVHVILPFPL